MKIEIAGMLKIDDNIMKNNDVIFHQISTQKYDNIYTNVIKKQIDVMNDELAQICGLNLTKETQGIITYCGVLLITDELKNMQNKKMVKQIEEFEKSRKYYLEIFTSQLYDLKNKIAFTDSGLMIKTCFQQIMDVKKQDSLKIVIDLLKN